MLPRYWAPVLMGVIAVLSLRKYFKFAPLGKWSIQRRTWFSLWFVILSMNAASFYAGTWATPFMGRVIWSCQFLLWIFVPCGLSSINKSDSKMFARNVLLVIAALINLLGAMTTRTGW